jgi:hypothetical protein
VHVIVLVKYVNQLIVEARTRAVHMVIENKMAVKYVNVMIHVIHWER